MDLHGDAEAVILLAQVDEDVGLILLSLFRGAGLAGHDLLVDGVDLFLGGLTVGDVVQTVVGSAAAQLVGNVVALGDGSLHALEVADLNASNLGEMLAVVGELLATLDAQGGIGAHGGNDLNVKTVVGGNLLVPLKAVGGVVGSADRWTA